MIDKFHSFKAPKGELHVDGILNKALVKGWVIFILFTFPLKKKVHPKICARHQFIDSTLNVCSHAFEMYSTISILMNKLMPYYMGSIKQIIINIPLNFLLLDLISLHSRKTLNFVF